MNKEIISDKQGIAIIILFIIGPSSVSLSGVEAEKDIWLAVILSMCMAVPIVLIYCKLHTIFPDKDLFDMIIICFGEFIGKGIIVFYIWNLIVTLTTILRNYGEFITTVNFVSTPMIIPMIFFGTLCVFVAKNGTEVLGRWGSFFLLIVASFTSILILLLTPEMNINNIVPIFSNGIKPIFLGATKLYSFPFSQLVVFSMIFSSFRKKESPYKVYLLGLLIGGIIILITFTSVLSVVGINSVSKMYYPTYSAVSRIEIMKIGRIEIISGTLFSFGGFVKMSVHLLAVCIGLSKLFKCRDYRFIVIPITLLLINLAYLSWDSTMSFYEFDGEMMLYFSFPFRTIFPIILFIIAKVKNSSKSIGIN